MTNGEQSCSQKRVFISYKTEGLNCNFSFVTDEDPVVETSYKLITSATRLLTIRHSESAVAMSLHQINLQCSLLYIEYQKR